MGRVNRDYSSKVSLDILAALPAGAAAETVAKEVAYPSEHQDRMDYRACAAGGQPIGSGRSKQPCRQYQCRFKWPSQF